MRSREAAVGSFTVFAAVAAMAIDHLVGTDDEDDSERFAEPGVFAGTALAALVVTFLLFRFVVRPVVGKPDPAATRALVCSLIAVVTLPLLFVAAPFPFAGSGLALGLVGRAGRRRRLATSAAGLGIGVLVLGVAAYVGELLT